MSDHQSCSAGNESANYFTAKAHAIIAEAAGHIENWTKYDHALVDLAREADAALIPDAAQCAVEWSDEDYKRARDCMRSILQDDYRHGRNPLLDLNFDNAFQHAVGILSLTARALAAQPPAAPVETVLKAVDFSAEHIKFEEWAGQEKYALHEHPLHYLFMDDKTNAARQGWKAALRYITETLKSAPGLSASHNSGERPPSSDAAGAGADTRSSADTEHDEHHTGELK